jgi:hypothetical protein
MAFVEVHRARIVQAQILQISELNLREPHNRRMLRRGVRRFHTVHHCAEREWGGIDESAQRNPYEPSACNRSMYGIERSTAVKRKTRKVKNTSKLQRYYFVACAGHLCIHATNMTFGN